MIAAGYKPETVRATLARAMIALAKTSESPRTDAQLLLAYVLGRDRAWLISHADTFLSKAQAEKYGSLIERRAEGTPVAYVLGSWGFYGREFEVTEDVLVPRPETERLVETAVEYLKSRVNKHAVVKQLFTVLDVGVGSGAIACSIAAEFAYAVVEGTDTNEKAVRVAERNARRLNVHGRCKFHVGDLMRPVEGKTYDCIVANLPYVPTADIPKAPHPVGFEPLAALDGGPDGLDCYRRLIDAMPALMRPDCLVLLEAAPRTIDGLRDLAAAAFPKGHVEVGRDLAGLDRFISVRVSRRKH